MTRSGGGLAVVAERLATLTGWHRLAAAFALGLVTALAFAPFNIVPILFIAFPAAIWLLDGCERGRTAFAVGWWFGFGSFLAGLYWVSNALLVDAERFAWLLPIVACGLPALLAIFPGGAFLAAWLARNAGPGRILTFSAAWAAAEWLRGHVLTGFPWNLIGYAWTGSETMIQPASLVGIYGVGLVTVLAASAPAALLPGRRNEGASAGRWLLVGAAAGLLLAGWIYGIARLPAGPAATVDGVQLRIVQANIDQRLKWQPEERVEGVRRHIRLSQGAMDGGTVPDVVIWPETAVPFALGGDPELRDALAQAIPPGGELLLTGAPRLERNETSGRQIWNSMVAVDPSGEIVATYDKFHLVPLGEYVPFRGVLGLFGIEKITAGATDFSTGPGPRTIRLPGLPPVSPLICYEVIFPSAVVPPGERPEWILNLTNDGWYGYSTGPFQHLAIASVRAVEEGLPLVRAANTGISAVVDPFGRVTTRLDLQTAGRIDAALPAALSPTLYSRAGDLPFLGLLLLTGVAVIPYRLSARRRHAS